MTTRIAMALMTAILAGAPVACGGSAGGDGSNPVKAGAREASPPGDIPDDQAFVRYVPPGAGFSVKVPEGWSRRTEGRAVVFTDKLNTIRLESRASGGPPTGAKVRRIAGTARRTTYLVRSHADPVTGRTRVNAVERYVFQHGGRDVVVTLSGPKGADNVDPWRIVTDSVRFTG